MTTETTEVVEIAVDKLERLSRMYSAEIDFQLEKARAALEDFNRFKTYSTWLTYKNVNDRLVELMVMRSAMRTHSDSFNKKFPGADNVLNQP